MKIYTLTEVLNKLNMRTKTQLQRKLGYKSTGTMSKWDREGIPPAAMMEIAALPEWEDETKETDYTLVVQGIIGKVTKLSELEQIEALRILAEKFPDEQTKERR